MKIGNKEYVLLWTKEYGSPQIYLLASRVDRHIILNGLYQTLLNMGMPKDPNFDINAERSNEEFKELIERFIQRASGTNIFGPNSGWVELQGKNED